MTEPQWIATSDVVFVTPDGTRTPGSIRISLPTPAFEHDAQCSYTLDPIVKGHPIYGSDALQALLLALRMCGMELAMFEARGGKIEYPTSAEGTPGERWDPKPTFGSFFRLPDESESKDAEGASKPPPSPKKDSEDR